MPRRSSSATLLSDPLASFVPATADWFRASFATPTDAQARGWPVAPDPQAVLDANRRTADNSPRQALALLGGWLNWRALPSRR